jgi:hypothetical protein
MLLREHTATRAGMHELYKPAVRADTEQRLQADFAKYQIARNAEAAHRLAGDTELKMAQCRDGMLRAQKRALAGSWASVKEVSNGLDVAVRVRAAGGGGGGN